MIHLLIIFTLIVAGLVALTDIGIEQGTGLVATAGILIAASKYVYEKERDRKNEIIDLISFFREEVISQTDAYSNTLKDELKITSKDIVKIELEEFSIEWLRNNRSSLAEKQAKQVLHNDNTKAQAIYALNAMEEFAAKVGILKASKSPELEILHAAYVTSMETMVIFVLAERELGPGETMFRNAVFLYQEWSKNLDRTTYDEKKKRLYKELGIKKSN